MVHLNKVAINNQHLQRFGLRKIENIPLTLPPQPLHIQMYMYGISWN